MTMEIDRGLIPSAKRCERVADDFVQMARNIFIEYPFVSDYLKELDGKSTETFAHSVLVALHMYDLMKKDGRFSGREVFEWSAAAFGHDAGKVTTDNRVLHSKEKFDDIEEGKARKEASFEHMMRHSIDGAVIGDSYGFTRRMMMGVVGHHIDEEALNKGEAGGFEGATASRKPWKKSFGEGYVEKVLMERFRGASELDYEAVKLLAFVDSVEALRSSDRGCKTAFPWKESQEDIAARRINPDIQKKKTVLGILKKDASEGKIEKELYKKAISRSFQTDFDLLNAFGVVDRIRSLVASFSKDTEVMIYDDKIEDIKKNPSCGREFFKEVLAPFGGKVFVLVDERLPGGKLSYESRSEPNFQAPVVGDMEKYTGPPGSGDEEEKSDAEPER